MPSNADDQVADRDSVRKRKVTESLWRRFIIIIGNFFSLGCFGFNYSLWPLLAGLDTVFEDDSINQEQDLKLLLYINIGVTGASALIAGLLSLKVGARKILFIGAVFSTAGLCLSTISKSVRFSCFTYGGLSGIGFGLTLTPSLVLLPAYFDSRLGSLFSLACSGIAVSICALPVLIDHVTHTYSRFSVFLLLAALNAHQAVFAALFRRPAGHGYREPQQLSPGACLRGLVCGGKRLVVLVTSVCVGAAFNILVLQLPTLCSDSNSYTGRVNCNGVMTICGVFMLLGLLLIGCMWFRQPKNERRYAVSMLLISTILSAVAGLLTLLPRSVVAFYLISAGIGLSCGMCLPLMLVLTNITRAENIPIQVPVGTSIMLFGVGALLGLFLGDFLTEVTGYKNSSFILSAIFMLTVSAMMLHWLLTGQSAGDVTRSHDPSTQISEMDSVPVDPVQTIQPRTPPSVPGLASVLGRQNNVHINEFHVHFHGAPGSYHGSRVDTRFNRPEVQQDADRPVTDLRFKRFLSVPLELEY